MSSKLGVLYMLREPKVEIWLRWLRQRPIYFKSITFYLDRGGCHSYIL